MQKAIVFCPFLNWILFLLLCYKNSSCLTYTIIKYVLYKYVLHKYVLPVISYIFMFLIVSVERFLREKKYKTKSCFRKIVWQQYVELSKGTESSFCKLLGRKQAQPGFLKSFSNQRVPCSSLLKPVYSPVNQ
jgi:hypothetical protein